MFQNFLKDERGVTAIEYATLAGTLGLAIITFMPSFAANTTSIYAKLLAQLSAKP